MTLANDKTDAIAAARKARTLVSEVTGAVTVTLEDHLVRIYGDAPDCVDVFSWATGWNYRVVRQGETSGQTVYRAELRDKEE
jgi:hypothetical protein